MPKKDFSKIYSYSKIKKFGKCPQEYYFYYLDPEWKGFQKPKDYKVKGSAIHGALTLFYHLPVEQRNLPNLKKSLLEAWFLDNAPKKKPPLGKDGGFEDIEHERKTYWESLEMLKRFFKLGDINPSLFYMPTKDIRQSFCDYEEMIKPINDEIYISGKFDRIDKLEDGSLKIIDFKTGRNNQDRFQLDFYKVLAEMNFNLPVSAISFYYLKNGKISDLKVPENSSLSIKQKILEKIENIQVAKKFPPKQSRLCDYCDFKPICPAF